MPEMLEQTKIGASKEKVWEILTNFATYKNWSKVITAVNFKNGLAVGNEGTYTCKVWHHNDSYRESPVTITKFESGNTLGWGVQKGCFIDSTWMFTVSDDGSGGCIFQHEMKVYGCFSPMVPTTKWFKYSRPFGLELKARAERA
mmetsp:Transcript_8618/g.17216  ORF Transcript_8618/g.17216 Transcript_8618/m.17216 type:complete len:144 (+) Transcript_8618:98-529(+)|eukprot:CAMPEP_0196719066 /NCGR_PEP_ID=MMETSP1091-20130531/2139_1 /TAXON_ID=302021 /ORGANISM="Rhodomonas sp., Strain CCMP768" /LENGTH=143 /DNA_ID=CAMNT_0042059925 /DNA_START=98 /DNA_END=529 /DNA_ORIENTATION=+